MALRFCFQILESAFLRIEYTGMGRYQKTRGPLTHILKSHDESIGDYLYNMRTRSVASEGTLGLEDIFHGLGAAQNDDGPIQHFNLSSK